ncbi:hypothetical protein [Capnocytophaga leadbetteri]|uniref:hypothetical protein n=1 Tax=Capnocytophaga leadbetteri TaxID=327575 RepID=UPI0028E7F1CD|nr:hypothetical protein [Capnocytophaga leadbetteri]
MKKIVFILLIITNGIALAQEGNAIFTPADSLTTAPKQQIGIGLSRFVNAAFPSDSNTFLLEYRYLKSPIWAYRVGGDYSVHNQTDSLYEVALKVGVDHLYKNYQRWHFYYGVDVWARHLYYKDRQQYFTSIAVNPFFGIQYKLSKNFSIATEPGFFLKYNIRRDRRSFDPNAQSDTWESRFAKIGVVQVNFHF